MYKHKSHDKYLIKEHVLVCHEHRSKAKSKVSKVSK